MTESRSRGGGQIHNFRRMLIYQRALELVAEVYAQTRQLPSDETFGLVSQLRRAAVSVVLNIAEGSGASSAREFGRFLEIARRPLYEIDACLEVCERLGLLSSGAPHATASHINELAAMISGFKSRVCGRAG